MIELALELVSKAIMSSISPCFILGIAALVLHTCFVCLTSACCVALLTLSLPCGSDVSWHSTTRPTRALVYLCTSLFHLFSCYQYRPQMHLEISGEAWLVLSTYLRSFLFLGTSDSAQVLLSTSTTVHCAFWLVRLCNGSCFVYYVYGLVFC